MFTQLFPLFQDKNKFAANIAVPLQWLSFLSLTLWRNCRATLSTRSLFGHVSQCSAFKDALTLFNLSSSIKKPRQEFIIPTTKKRKTNKDKEQF